MSSERVIADIKRAYSSLQQKAAVSEGGGDGDKRVISSSLSKSESSLSSFFKRFIRSNRRGSSSSGRGSSSSGRGGKREKDTTIKNGKKDQQHKLRVKKTAIFTADIVVSSDFTTNDNYDVPKHLTPIALQPSNRFFNEVYGGGDSCTTSCASSASDLTTDVVFRDENMPPLPVGHKTTTTSSTTRHAQVRKAASENSIDPVVKNTTTTTSSTRTSVAKRRASTFPRKNSHNHVVKETLHIYECIEESLMNEIRKQLHIDSIVGIINNRYVIIKEIGEGSFSRVYLVYNLDEKRYYACKAVSKKRLKKKSMWRNGPQRKKSNSGGGGVGCKTDYMEMVRHEIAILKRLSKHPHIATLVEVLDDQRSDVLYMIMELCEYGSIMQLKKNSIVASFNEETSRRYFRDMVLGVEYLHYMRIVHRDLKPENILLNAGNHAVIGDFSISSYSSADVENIQHGKGNSIFTPLFTPPELCNVRSGGGSGGGGGNENGREFDPAIDIWGLGVTLYCFVHGHVPFTGDDVEEIYFKISAISIRSLMKNTLSNEIKDLIEKLLEKDPKKRIRLEDVKMHPWVTARGSEMMPSTEENCVYLLEDDELTPAEIENAVTPAVTFIDKLRLLRVRK